MKTMRTLIAGLWALGWMGGMEEVQGSPLVQAAEEAVRMPGEESAAASFLATGEVDLEDPEHPGTEGRVALQEAAVMVPVVAKEWDSLLLAGGAFAGWTRLDFQGFGGVDADDLYGRGVWAGVERPSKTGWGWSALAMPGFYSDFRSGRTGEGKVLLHAAAEYPFASGWRVQLGMAYDTAFGDPAVYPVGGVIWQATEQMTVNVLLPSPSVYWALSDRWGLFALAQPAGDRWIVEDDEAGEQEFLIESWRAGVGAEYRVWESVWLRVAGGMDFERRYEVTSDNRTVLDEDVDDTFYGSVALVLY